MGDAAISIRLPAVVLRAKLREPSINRGVQHECFFGKLVRFFGLVSTSVHKISVPVGAAVFVKNPMRRLNELTIHMVAHKDIFLHVFLD